MIRNPIASSEFHRQCPRVPIRSGGFTFGNQRNIKAIGAIEECERLAHGINAF